MDTETIDFYINENTEEATFDYYMDDGVYIESITFKSIAFYNSWWTADFLPFTLRLANITKGEVSDYEKTETFYLFEHFSLSEFCRFWNKYLEDSAINNVRFSCDESNYVILELTEDTNFNLQSLEDLYPGGEPKNFLEVIKKWFGFKQDSFEKKGKYYSTKPLNFYLTSLNLKSNLVNKKNTLYNNKHSDILCVIPVEDGDQIKYQRYEPKNCNKSVNDFTNHIKLEITDSNGKVVNFRGTPIALHLQLNILTHNK